jgi:DNA gyrase/topoisomerase IV subunit B
MITRLKGWGECDAEDLATLCVSPKTRKLIQMKWDDTAIETLEKTMSKEGKDDRKTLLGVN